MFNWDQRIAMQGAQIQADTQVGFLLVGLKQGDFMRKKKGSNYMN